MAPAALVPGLQNLSFIHVADTHPCAVEKGERTSVLAVWISPETGVRAGASLLCRTVSDRTARSVRCRQGNRQAPSRVSAPLCLRRSGGLV